MKNSQRLRNIFLLFAISIFSMSCHKGGTISEVYIKMKNATWDRFDQKYVEIPVEKTTKNLDITLVVRNTAKFAYDDLPLYIILTTPDGEERVHEMSLRLRQDGKMKGVAKGNIFETRTLLFDDLTLSGKGSCKISIESLIPKIQTEGIDEIGIVLTDSK